MRECPEIARDTVSLKFFYKTWARQIKEISSEADLLNKNKESHKSIAWQGIREDISKRVGDRGETIGGGAVFELDFIEKTFTETFKGKVNSMVYTNVCSKVFGLASFVFLFSLPIGCSGGDFIGKSNSNKEQNSSNAVGTAKQPASTTTTTNTNTNTDIATATSNSTSTETTTTTSAATIDPNIQSCSDQWGGQDLPFSDAQKAKPKLFPVTGVSSILEDGPTNSPVLTFVDVQLSGGSLFGIPLPQSAAAIALCNPKAWYCIKIKTQLISAFEIVVHKDAQYAIVQNEQSGVSGGAVVRDRPNIFGNYVCE